MLRMAARACSRIRRHLKFHLSLRGRLADQLCTLWINRPGTAPGTPRPIILAVHTNLHAPFSPVGSRMGKSSSRRDFYPPAPSRIRMGRMVRQQMGYSLIGGAPVASSAIVSAGMMSCSNEASEASSSSSCALPVSSDCLCSSVGP